MELQATIFENTQINTVPINHFVKENPAEYISQNDRIQLKTLLKKNREIFNRHVARLTKLQKLISAEEAIIADCLDKEKLLLSVLG